MCLCVLFILMVCRVCELLDSLVNTRKQYKLNLFTHGQCVSHYSMLSCSFSLSHLYFSLDDYVAIIYTYIYFFDLISFFLADESSKEEGKKRR